MTDTRVGQRRRKHFGMKLHNPKRGALPQGTRDMCKWYPVCPMKVFYERGVLDAYWIEQFCFGNHERCVRYRMEETGRPHPDNMLPDGSTDDQLPA